MHDGAQWITGGLDTNNLTVMGRRPTNWNPDTNKLVATINRIPKLIQECGAASFIDRLEVSIDPSDRDVGMESVNKAQVLEATTNALVDMSGFVEAARTASFRRCIDGTHGIGWGLTMKPRNVALRGGGTEVVQDQILKAFTYDSTRLILDPFCQKLDLHEHEFVLYSDVKTIDQLRRDFGITDINENELPKCGELWAQELEYNTMSQNRLYTTLPQYSQTRGSRVFQLHQKDDQGRFSVMLVGVQMPRGKEIRWINFENPETPFGGCGLPLSLLHGYRRPDSMWSISDVAMLKDDQDRLNLLHTFFMRMFQKNAGYQWLVSEGSQIGGDFDEFKSQFNNYVAGVIGYKAPTRDRPNTEPKLVRYPDPPAFVQDTMQQYQGDMREQVHRPDITQGATKTHVPNSSYQAALQGANQVLGNRIREDIGRYEALLDVGLGTVVKLVQEKSPFVLGELAKRGFDEQDYTVLSQTDPYCTGFTITIRDSSIKYESKEQKEERLWKAVQLQAVTDPMKLRMALAGMDTPLDKDDKTFYTAALKATTDILYGMEWQPFDLGEYAGMFITQFQSAMFDRRAKSDPETRARLERAINGQRQLALMATQQQAMAENPQPPEEETPEETQQEGGQEEGPSEADLGQLLQAIQAGSTQGAASAPVAA